MEVLSFQINLGYVKVAIKLASTSFTHEHPSHSLHDKHPQEEEEESSVPVLKPRGGLDDFEEELHPQTQCWG